MVPPVAIDPARIGPYGPARPLGGVRRHSTPSTEHGRHSTHDTARPARPSPTCHAPPVTRHPHHQYLPYAQHPHPSLDRSIG